VNIGELQDVGVTIAKHGKLATVVDFTNTLVPRDGRFGYTNNRATELGGSVLHRVHSSQGFDELGWVGNIGILHSDRSSILRWWRHSRLIDGEHSEFVFTVLDQVVHIDLGRMTQSHIDTLPVHG